MKNFTSSISNKEFQNSEKVSAKSIQRSLFEFIKLSNPEFNEHSFLSISELNYFREKYISVFLLNELGELNELEKTVLNSLSEKTILSDAVNDSNDTENASLGQRIADKVASVGGSWKFIISFGVFLVIWINLNVYWLSNSGFDPYPFILLNLILSCIAALQAPVIMMSQNRQEEKDRERAKKDYMINLKSELEIRMLHDKIDHLILHQQQDLLEIQNIQIQMMNDILKKLETK